MEDDSATRKMYGEFGVAIAGIEVVLKQVRKGEVPSYFNVEAYQKLFQTWANEWKSNSHGELENQNIRNLYLALTEEGLTMLDEIAGRIKGLS